jgi:hypothetical protein
LLDDHRAPRGCHPDGLQHLLSRAKWDADLAPPQHPNTSSNGRSGDENTKPPPAATTTNADQKLSNSSYCSAEPGAVQHCQTFFPWYNDEHRHGGLGLHTAPDVHYGTAITRGKRAGVLDAAYAAHPAENYQSPPRSTRQSRRSNPLSKFDATCLKQVDKFRKRGGWCEGTVSLRERNRTKDAGCFTPRCAKITREAGMHQALIIVLLLTVTNCATSLGPDTAESGSTTATIESAAELSTQTEIRKMSTPSNSLPSITPSSTAPFTAEPTAPLASSTGPGSESGAVVQLTGTVQKGVEEGCVVLVDDNAAVVANLVGQPITAYTFETRIQVTGSFQPSMMTVCQQGTPFSVTDILQL